MIDADIDGVSHLTVRTRANLVRRRITGDWTRRADSLAGLHALYEPFRARFEDVDWIKSSLSSYTSQAGIARRSSIAMSSSRSRQPGKLFERATAPFHAVTSK